DLAVRGAMLAALRDDTALMALVNQVSDGEPVKASPPWLQMGDPVATGWGARGVDGLTVRQPLQLVLRGDDLARVTAILTAVDTALAALDGDLGEWRITSLRFERSRIARGAAGWRASIDYVARAARAG
ncbi:MAG: hypothetical protein ABS86_02505, partial [Sphingobium sp. SCN 64-10]